jgi:mitogen-activated protein kinase 15
MHSAKLVHRDMKPANLLLNSECLMKVADFGLARSLLTPRPRGGEAGPSVDVGDEPSMDTLTDYVATRWYRAPEILFASDKYGVEVDMWSLGCIFAEMIGGKPVFNGKTTLNQVELIVNFVGYPSEEMMENGINSHYGSKMLESANVLSTPEQGPLSEAAQKAKWMELYGSFLQEDVKDDSVDLLYHLMQFDPRARLTAQAGLTHRYCVQFSDPQTETICATKIVAKPDDNVKLTVAAYRSAIYDNLDKKSKDAPKQITAVPAAQDIS